MKLATDKSINNRPQCPGCGEPAFLAILTNRETGSQWVNCACRPCGYAMDNADKWTFYAGGLWKARKGEG